MLLFAIILAADHPPVAAHSALVSPDAQSGSTRIHDLNATASDGTITITGVTQYRDALSGSFYALPGVKVTLSVGQATGSLSYVGETYSDDSDGSFTFTWLSGLEPGQYFAGASYAGGDTFNGYYNGSLTPYVFQATETNVQFLVPLELSISVDFPMLSIAQGNSATVTVKVAATNSKNAQPVSLSLTSSSQLFATETFSPQSGSTPLTSKLSLNVLNVTQPGSYSMTIIATSQQGNLPAVVRTAPLQILVQQNTRAITVSVQGLPGSVQTSLYLDGTFLETLGSGAVPLTISNNNTVISVTQEILSGDTRYFCQLYSQSLSDPSVSSFVFSYDTEYKFTMKADLPQDIVFSNLTLIVNGSDYSQENVRAAKGFTDFFRQNSVIAFGFSPSRITTDTVDYSFTVWKDLTTGDTISNVTSDGLYQITFTRPYYLESYYEKWVDVSFRTNLPSDMTTRLSFGMAGSANQSVTVPGSVTYQAGEYLVGSTFELDVPSDQLVLYNSAGDTRYEFQAMTPLTPMTLTQHTRISLNYSVEYRVLVVSQFPSGVLQPDGGVGWYSPGDLATIQAQDSANDHYGIPYLFLGWSGALTSNETSISFPVTRPMEVQAQWKPNWMSLLTLAIIGVAVTVPSVWFVKRELRRVVGAMKARKKTVKTVPKSASKKPGKLSKASSESERDLKLYNYIIDKGGSMSIKDAMKDLGMDREEISAAVARLKESHMLG